MPKERTEHIAQPRPSICIRLAFAWFQTPKWTLIDNLFYRSRNRTNTKYSSFSMPGYIFHLTMVTWRCSVIEYDDQTNVETQALAGYRCWIILIIWQSLLVGFVDEHIGGGGNFYCGRPRRIRREGSGNFPRNRVRRRIPANASTVTRSGILCEVALAVCRTGGCPGTGHPVVFSRSGSCKITSR